MYFRVVDVFNGGGLFAVGAGADGGLVVVGHGNQPPNNYFAIFSRLAKPARFAEPDRIQPRAFSTCK